MSETLENAAAAPAAGDDLDSVINAAWEDDDRAAPARDERGRFTSSRQDAPVEDVAEESTEQPEAEAEPDVPAIDPPAGWSDDEKAHWASLSREVQETILRRERGMDERAQEASQWASLREVLEPYRAHHAMMGLTPRDAVQRLLAAEEMLRQNPDRAFPELARAYGYDLRRLIPAAPQQPDAYTQQQPQQQQFQDPRVDRLLQEMEQRRQQETLAQIQAFADDPAHPHFSDVRADMGRLIAANPDLPLKRAYEIAVAASPSVQTKIREAEQRAAAEKARKEAAEKAAAAKRAAVSVRDRSPSGGGPMASAPKSIEELLEEAYGG